MDMADLTVRFPDGMYQQMDELVGDDGFFQTKTELVRYAVRTELQRERVEPAGGPVIEHEGPLDANGDPIFAEMSDVETLDEETEGSCPECGGFVTDALGGLTCNDCGWQDDGARDRDERE